MNLLSSVESAGTSQYSRKFHEFIENIGLANIFHCCSMESHRTCWPGQYISRVCGSHRVSRYAIAWDNFFQRLLVGNRLKSCPGQVFPTNP